MKKILLSIALLSPCFAALSQNGLESVIVEKYYISDANDQAADLDGGVLPVGSVTYRIFVDMLPGYKFQAAYGVPDHELRIETTTLFFNNEDRGATFPTYSKTQAARNTVMLDSWLSVGAACTGQFGVMKSEDNGVATVVNTYSPQVLQNNNPLAGIPLSQEDGLIAGTPEPVTAVGISSEVTVFDNQNDGTNGPAFVTTNGSWASLNGSTGPDPATNKVLIAQITTDGTFSFALNVQIGTPSGGVENYVANNPVGSEILEPTLTYNSLTAEIGSVSYSKENHFVLYPNPANSSVNLEFVNKPTSNVNCSVSTITGQEVLNQTFTGSSSQKFSMDISFLTPGLYVIKVQSNEKTEFTKFLKQ